MNVVETIMRSIRCVFAVVLFFNLIGVASGQTLVDEFGYEIDDGILARLDNLRTELLKHPGSRGFVLDNKPKQMPLGEFLRRLHGFERTWQSRGYPPSDLVVLPGKEIDRYHTEFWLVNDREQFKPQVFSIKDALAKHITKQVLFDKDCVSCSPAVVFADSSLYGGLDYLGIAMQANHGCHAVILVGDAEGTGTQKGRRTLQHRIHRVLETKYQIPARNIDIRFVKSDFAKFYIVPSNMTFRRK